MKIFSKIMFRNWYRFIYVLLNIDKEIIKLITNFYLIGNNSPFIIKNTFLEECFSLMRDLIPFQIDALLSLCSSKYSLYCLNLESRFVFSTVFCNILYSFAFEYLYKSLSLSCIFVSIS